MKRYPITFCCKMFVLIKRKCEDKKEKMIKEKMIQNIFVYKNTISDWRHYMKSERRQVEFTLNYRSSSLVLSYKMGRFLSVVLSFFDIKTKLRLSFLCNLFIFFISLSFLRFWSCFILFDIGHQVWMNIFKWNS